MFGTAPEEILFFKRDARATPGRRRCQPGPSGEHVSFAVTHPPPAARSFAPLRQEQHPLRARGARHPIRADPVVVEESPCRPSPTRIVKLLPQRRLALHVSTVPR